MSFRKHKIKYCNMRRILKISKMIGIPRWTRLIRICWPSCKAMGSRNSFISFKNLRLLILTNNIWKRKRLCKKSWRRNIRMAIMFLVKLLMPGEIICDYLILFSFLIQGKMDFWYGRTWIGDIGFVNFLMIIFMNSTFNLIAVSYIILNFKLYMHHLLN